MSDKDERVKEHWMTFSQVSINVLTEEDWEHYKEGGCLCYARCPFECSCGAWDSILDFGD